MHLIHEIKAARSSVKVYKQPRYDEYTVKLYHLQEKPHFSGRGDGVFIEYHPAIYSTDCKEDAIETAKKMLEDAQKTIPADPVRYNEWRKATFKYVEKAMLSRAKNAGIKSEADYISGALAAMMAAAEQFYKIESDQLGCVVNPFWMFGVMRGGFMEELKKKHQEEAAQ